jgi:hypothetical protein
MKRVVEINGVKVEVDLREAVAVETMRVGDAVRVLVKNYGGTYAAHDGVVIGFDQFKNLPTITVAYAEIGYSNADVRRGRLRKRSSERPAGRGAKRETAWGTPSPSGTGPRMTWRRGPTGRHFAPLRGPPPQSNTA